MNIETANRLLQYRKQHNLSQEELAEKIGVSRQAVSKWERAEASPDTDNLIRIAELYGVSLDELLKGNKDYSNDTEQAESNASYYKEDRVSFKNGINVNSKNGDRVHVGFDGITVEEGGKQRVYTDENGNVMVDENLKHNCENSHAHKMWNRFPIYAIALIAFLIWGFSGVLFGWALSWICFLAVPLYYTTVDAVFKRNPAHFAFPVLAVALYIIFGFFGICGGWSWGWIVFLTIPLYYWVCSLYGKTDDDEDDD